MNTGKKKLVGILIAGTLVLGTFGGTTYAAFGDNLEEYISHGIESLMSFIFPEIKEKTEAKEDEVTGKITTEMRSAGDYIYEQLVVYKDELIERNETELDKYYNTVSEKIKTANKTIVKDNKAEITAEADAQLAKSKQDIEKKMNAELEKVEDDIIDRLNEDEKEDKDKDKDKEK